MARLRGMVGIWFATYALLGCDHVFGLDAIPDVPTAPQDGPEVCFGRNGPSGSGLFQACVPEQGLPDRLDTAVGAIDTGTDCQRVVTQPDPDQTEVCVVAAVNVTIDSTLLVRGPRPLVLVATNTFTLLGTLDVASHVGDATTGAFPACAAPSGSNDGNGGGGGGAGGSFGSSGGSGGTGDSNGPGGAALPASTRPAFVRGGCVGGNGGDSSSGPKGGAGGGGGGAIYAIAGTQIRISGRINASGAGGGGGTKDSSGRPAGGGGGGTGGLIALDAPMIALETSAVLIANGGGGGAGASVSTSGAGGTEPSLGGVPPYGTSGGAGPGGAGGAGADVTRAATSGATSASGAGGGGGGGGYGYILLFGSATTVAPTAFVSPALNAP